MTLGIEIKLDLKSGVPFYRQIIDQVKTAMATGRLESGDRLPTVRQLAVNLSINPNTVSRAYTELELTGLVETQMGSGTFVGTKQIEQDEAERRRICDQICQDFLSRASSYGFTIEDILENLRRRLSAKEGDKK
ncbi:MAG: GntR family transcriptional regulator [Candidatus Eisenbacteria bacterium]|uniref:GntR family transcriptional regulator n=1 Tax=Eiseniibacteriota bacterium TaxID=2212470 RepID=A0A948RW90_UNCEI|nr:GntR family transcriptional regulator [Candidatus Eisenbacteria bacterium]MBU1949778.1 GntR family transcriptional regulator [Candidatus Eisenbacteria bacterium]MBU2689419.1 GntR family transcriptional regulator [Candidatus Eisenbacteria bacterium]